MQEYKTYDQNLNRIETLKLLTFNLINIPFIEKYHSIRKPHENRFSPRQIELALSGFLCKINCFFYKLNLDFKSKEHRIIYMNKFRK